VRPRFPTTPVRRIEALCRSALPSLGALLGALLLGSVPLQAQEADPADVASQDAIIAALYDVISGPAGEARDWDRFHSLFIVEGARLIPTGVNSAGIAGYNVLTPEDYVEAAGASLEANGFFESEIGRTTQEFGNIAHVFSAYDSRRTADDVEPFARGINSIQLFYDGSRWWITTVLWDSERPDNPIPGTYLGG